MQKVLNKYPFLVVKKGSKFDTISIDVKKTGLDLTFEDKIYIISKIYDELIGLKGYQSISQRGAILKLIKW